MGAEVLSVITLTWHQTWFVQTKSHQIIARRKDSDFVEQPGCAQFSPINPPEIYRPQRRAVSHAIATSIHNVIKRKIGYYIRRLSHFMIDSFWIDQRVLCGGTYHTFHALTLSRLTDAGTINMDVPFKLRWWLLMDSYTISGANASISTYWFCDLRYPFVNLFRYQNNIFK